MVLLFAINATPSLMILSAWLDDVTFESAGFGAGRFTNATSGSGYTYDYYLTDHLGSTRMVLNNAGTVTEAIHYQPYGTMESITASNPEMPVRDKFTTKEFDEDGATEGINGAPGLKLNYFGARYYVATG